MYFISFTLHVLALQALSAKQMSARYTQMLYLILVTLSMVAALTNISIFENRGMPDML